eukprot:gene10264-21417_t
MKYIEPKRNFKPFTQWIYGKSETGKTRAAYEEYPNAYRKSQNTYQWWDGYDADEDVIIDDVKNTDLKTYLYLLELLDRYECRVQVAKIKPQSKKQLVTKQQLYRAINRNIETKKSFSSYSLTAFNSGISAVADLLTVIPPVNLGTGEDERVGTQISPVKLVIKGYITYACDVLDNIADIQAKIILERLFLFQDKAIRQYGNSSSSSNNRSMQENIAILEDSISKVGGTLCSFLAIKSNQYKVPRKIFAQCKHATCQWDSWQHAISFPQSNIPKRIVLSYGHNGLGNQLWEHTVAFMIAESLGARLLIAPVPSNLCPDHLYGNSLECFPPHTLEGMSAMKKLLPDNFEYELLSNNSIEHKLCEAENFFIADRSRDWRDANYKKHFLANIVDILTDTKPHCLKILGYFQDLPLCADDAQRLWTPRMISNYTEENRPGKDDISIYLRCIRHYHFNDVFFYESILNHTTFKRVWLFQAPECNGFRPAIPVLNLLRNRFNATSRGHWERNEGLIPKMLETVLERDPTEYMKKHVKIFYGHHTIDATYMSNIQKKQSYNLMAWKDHRDLIDIMYDAHGYKVKPFPKDDDTKRCEKIRKGREICNRFELYKLGLEFLRGINSDENYCIDSDNKSYKILETDDLKETDRLSPASVVIK